MGFVMIGLVAAHPVVGFRSMVTMLKSSLRKTKWKPIAATALLPLVLVVGFKVYATYYGEEGEDETITVELPSNVSSLILEDVAKAYDVSITALIEWLKETCNVIAQPEELLDEIITNNRLDRESFKEELADAIEKLRGGES